MRDYPEQRHGGGKTLHSVGPLRWSGGRSLNRRDRGALMRRTGARIAARRQAESAGRLRARVCRVLSVPHSAVGAEVGAGAAQGDRGRGVRSKGKQEECVWQHDFVRFGEARRSVSRVQQRQQVN
jgi:hypothetical protein